MSQGAVQYINISYVTKRLVALALQPLAVHHRKAHYDENEEKSRHLSTIEVDHDCTH